MPLKRRQRRPSRRIIYVLLISIFIREILSFSPILSPLTIGALEAIHHRDVSCFMGLAYKQRRMQNVPGNMFVDESCIDCDVCRWMDPKTFSRVGLGSVVKKQPVDDEEVYSAFRAMIACPTGSIRTFKGDPRVNRALDCFPFPIASAELEGIFHLGYHSSESGGATPYFITLPSRENVMVDVPRYSRRLADKIESIGGIQYMVITHGDNVYGHERWKQRFPMVTRIIHSLDTMPSTRKLERKLEGEGPWYVGESNDLKILHTPGHTDGSICLLYVKQRAVFTGDTIGYSGRRECLDGWSRENRTTLKLQARSIRQLAQEEFLFIFPGKGKHIQFDNISEMEKVLEEAAETFQKNGYTYSF